MTPCAPAAKRGTSQKIQCAVHCYSGSVDGRIQHLEEQLDKARTALRQAQIRNMELSDQNWWLKQGRSMKEAEHSSLQMKVQRQRRALMLLQEKRQVWEPELIIFESDSPDDYVIEEDAA